MTIERESGRARVLVIDDEPLICDVIRMMLEENHDVVTAGSGAEAQRVLATDRDFDVILCDLMMTDVSGIELHAWLKEQHPQLAARMVFMTGGAYTTQSREFLEAIPNRTIGKPLVWETVEQTVREIAAEA